MFEAIRRSAAAKQWTVLKKIVELSGAMAITDSETPEHSRTCLQDSQGASSEWKGWNRSGRLRNQGQSLLTSGLRQTNGEGEARGRIRDQRVGPAGERAERNLTEPTGFEPAIFCVTGRHVRPLHHGSSIIAAPCWVRIG